MKPSFRNMFVSGAALLGVASLLVGCHAAEAQTRSPNIRILGAVSSTASSTFATTAFADLPAATQTFTPARDYATTGAPGELNPIPHLHVFFNADVIKATATTGICGIFANGAEIAASERAIDFAAKRGTMTLFADVAEATSGSQVIKVQCKSGDTNVFTVSTGVLYSEEVY